MIKPTVLVTGATGKTGSAVVAKLRGLDFPVRALVHRLDHRSQRLGALGAEIVVGDFLEPQSIRSAMAGARRVYFCYPPQGDRLLEAASNIAVAARDEGIEALVNMSQLPARENASSPLTLKIMLGVALSAVPAVIVYQAWSYRLFSGSLDEDVTSEGY